MEKSALSSSEFWNVVHTENPSAEWYLSSQVVLQHLEKLLEGRLRVPNEANDVSGCLRLLHIGCGVSELSFHLHAWMGHVWEVFNIDFSSVAIAEMERKLLHLDPCSYKNIRFQCMDALELRLKKNFFDLVVDKGTMDSLLSAEDSRLETSKILLENFHRVLRKGGCVVSFSVTDPTERMPILAIDEWIVSYSKVDHPPTEYPQMNHTFVYFMIKR